MDQKPKDFIFIRDSNCASDGTLILVADVLFITLDYLR